jgi:hypothetical protein
MHGRNKPKTELPTKLFMKILLEAEDIYGRIILK